MATWMVHLRLAESLLSLIGELDEAYFALGSVAPDSGIPDKNWETFDPPAEVLHFSTGAAAMRRSADLEFHRQYLAPLSQWQRSLRFSFLLGYFFHLATDNLWAMEIGLPMQQRFAAELEADPKFVWQVKRDWYGLDFAYVRRERDSLFWRVFLSSQYAEHFLDFLPREAVQQRLEYIKGFYQRSDARVEGWYVKRPNLYLSEGEMNRFVADAGARLFRAFQHLQRDPDTTGFSSILELAMPESGA